MVQKFKVTGCTAGSNTVSVLVRGSNKLVLHEAERSIHDALCVIRCLVKKRAIIAGGGAPETELAVHLSRHAHTLSGVEAYCFQVRLSLLPLLIFYRHFFRLFVLATFPVTELARFYNEAILCCGIPCNCGEKVINLLCN